MPRFTLPISRRTLLALLPLLALFLLIAPSACHAAQPAKLRVVATHSVLGDLVQHVAADRIDLLVLVGPDSDTHTYEPTPSDAHALATANLIFENGLGFESWLDKLYQASGSKAPRSIVTLGVKPHDMDEPADAPASSSSSSSDKKSSDQGTPHEIDPHAWHDVHNVIIMVQNISDSLCKADPANASTYKANAATYTKELQTLDHDVVALIDTIPPSRRKLVTTHDALGYYARRYGFVILGSGLNSISTESAEPSALELSQLIKRIKDSGVPTLFLENIQNSKLMDQIAHEAHVKIGPPLFTDALGKPGSEGDTYIKMIRFNTKAIVQGLKP